MGRLIFLALLLLLAFALWRWLVNRFAGNESKRPLETNLVRCAQCNTHVPRDTASRAHDGWRCPRHAEDGKD